MAKQELTPEQEYAQNYQAYEQAEAKRLNTLAALAYAKKYTVRTGNPKPPRLNSDGSEMTGEEGTEEQDTEDEEADPTENADRKYSCVMVTVDETALTADIHALHSFFDVDDIIELELQPHITIKYGLHTSNFADVVPYLTGVESIDLHIGDLSLFSSATQDVLKFTVSSDDLVNIRSNIDRLPNTDDYPTYNPHLTVAYLKPGTGHKYLGHDCMSKGMVLQARSILFSTPERSNNEITLNVFCATGAGGGIDPSCSPKSSKISTELVDEIFTAVTGFHDTIKLDLPVKSGIKAAPKCKGGQGDCTNQSFLEYKRSGAEVWVGEVVLPESIESSKEDLKRNLEKYGDGSPGPTHSIPHAWNVIDGKIVDHALGSKHAKDYIYFGKRVPNKVLDKLKHGDDIASLDHPLKPDYSVYDRITIPQPTDNAFCPTGSGGGVDPSCSPKKQYVTKVKVPKLKLPSKPDFISSQKGNVKENKKAVNELTKLAKAGNVSAVASHPATPSPKVVKYKADLLKALDAYHKGIGTAGLALAGVKPKAATPPSNPQKPDAGKTVGQKQAQTGQTTTDAAKDVVGGLGLTAKQVKDALTTDASPASSSKAQHRVDIVAAILNSGTAMKDAAVHLVNKQDKEAIKARVLAISSGEVSRAVKEYADTPLYDLNILSAIKVHDKPLSGQAVCYMADRRVEMGTTSVTGDFRHELGHAIRASWDGNSYGNKTALTQVVHDEYEDAMARVKKDPPPGGIKLSHDEYETKYGVVGRRSLDNWEEHAAEHFRLYHREIYRDRNEGGNGKYVNQYRTRHPKWAELWDAHYTAALIGTEL